MDRRVLLAAGLLALLAGAALAQGPTASDASPPADAAATQRPLLKAIEALRERVQAAGPGSLGTCIHEVRPLMVECLRGGTPAAQCAAKVAREVGGACSRLNLTGAGGGSCVAGCAREREACLASRPASECNQEGLACLTRCPVVGGLVMRMERLRGLHVNPAEASAMDANRRPVEVAAGAMEVRRAAAGSAGRGELVLSLPVKLAIGKRLAEFRDRGSGISLENGSLSIPMRAGSEVAAYIRARIGQVVGQGDSADATVESLRMETKAYEANLSAEKPAVGRVMARLAADLKDLPENAEVGITPRATLAVEEQKAVEAAARDEGLRVKEVAYAVEVQHDNLTGVEGANVTLTVSRAWVESQGGPEKVRIIREGDNGTKQVLETTFMGYDGDDAVFVGRSPGLSVFSLVAVEEGTPTAPAARPSPPYGLIGLVAAVGIGVAVALGLAKRPPGGKMNPWLRMSMRASGDLKDVEGPEKGQGGGGQA